MMLFRNLFIEQPSYHITAVK